MPDEQGALWIPNTNYFPNRNGNTPCYIVLHGTAGGSSAQGIANYFASTQGGANPVSSHYVVGTDGAIVQCIAESEGAWANGYISGLSGTSGDGVGNGYHDSWWGNDGNPNNVSISIEHVKSATDNSNMLTTEQQQASFTLIQHICQRHNIPMRKADASGGITGHYSIDALNRPNCPGPYPWDELWKFLGETNTVTTLEGFPMKSQLADTTEVDRYYICVATSIAAALEWLTKTPFDGAAIKDVIYGATYQGMTAPQAYIDYCAKQGVHLSPINGDNIVLVPSAKQQLVQNKPVLLTEVDPYLPTSSGATHMVVAYACDANSITVMDPFVGKPVTKTDQQWQSDLRFNQIWTMEKETSMVPAGWHDDGKTLTAPNKHTVTLGFRDYVLANSWEPSNYPLEEAHGQNPLELSNPGLGSGTQQVFLKTVLEWTPSQGVFVAWSGQELLKMRDLLAQNKPTTPIVTINTQQAISTLQTINVAIQAVLHDLGAS